MIILWLKLERVEDKVADKGHYLQKWKIKSLKVHLFENQWLKYEFQIKNWNN